MPHPNKPGISWPKIKELYEAGETPTQIAKKFDVRRQSIEDKAERQGWGKPRETIASRIKELVPADVKLPGSNAVGLEKVGHAVALIERGVSRRNAALAAGIASSTFYRQVDENPHFREMIEAAEARRNGAFEGAFMAAAEVGDWRAAEAALQRYDRELWGGTPGSKSGGVTVVFNWDRDEPPPKPTVDVND